jgi:FRG domain
MNAYRIKDPIDLHHLFRGYRSHGGVGWIFRGQANISWPLIPKAGRSEFRNGNDLGRFHDWRKRAYAHGPLPDNDWECLAIAQHYGLATRLLDWSCNPLVATYFAVNEHLECDGAIYCFSPGLFIDCATLSIGAQLAQVTAYLPRAIDQRVSRQSGVFTVHNDAISEIDVKELDHPLSGTNLVRIEIPQQYKLPILEMLDDYGVHGHGIFPDLDGLSHYINWKTNEIVRKRDLRDSKKG